RAKTRAGGEHSQALKKRILHEQIAKALSVLKIFAVKHFALALKRGGNDQCVVPGELTYGLQMQSLQEQGCGRRSRHQGRQHPKEIPLHFSGSKGIGKFSKRNIHEFLNDLVADHTKTGREATCNESLSNLCFARLVRIERVYEYIRVEEKLIFAHSFHRE